MTGTTIPKYLCEFLIKKKTERRRPQMAAECEEL